MDAYYSLSMGALDADLEAAELFPGLELPTELPTDLTNGPMAVGQTWVQGISNGSGAERITMKYVTPISIQDFQGKTPPEIVRQTGGARVRG